MPPPEIDPELEQVVADDLDYLAALIERNPITNAELRRASVVLRGLVYEDRLQRAASPRLHKLTIAMPDAEDLIASIEADREVEFFQLGSFKALGIEISGATIERRDRPRDRPFTGTLAAGSLKNFKRQTVFYVRAVAIAGPIPAMFSGAVSREGVIKYAAHKMGGAHLDMDRTDKEQQLLDIVRKAATMSLLKDGTPSVGFNVEVLNNPIARAATPLPGIGASTKDFLDPVLLELLGAARFIVESPSVQELRSKLCT